MNWKENKPIFQRTVIPLSYKIKTIYTNKMESINIDKTSLLDLFLKSEHYRRTLAGWPLMVAIGDFLTELVGCDLTIFSNCSENIKTELYYSIFDNLKN
jgi:hypothetical protein